MKISAILLLASSVAAAVLPVEQRATTQVQTDLVTLKNAYDKGTKDTNNYNGGLAGAIQVGNDAKAIDDDTKQVSSDANSSGAFSSSTATAINSYIVNSLEPSAKKAIQTLIAHESQIAAAGLMSYVCSGFQTLYTDTQAMCAALTQKSPSAQGKSITSSCGKVLADVKQGENVYCG